MLFNVEVMLVTQNLLKQNQRVVSTTFSCLCKYKIPFVYKCKLPYLITPFFKQPEQVAGVFELLTPINHLFFFQKLLMTFNFMMKVTFCSIHFFQRFWSNIWDFQAPDFMNFQINLSNDVIVQSYQAYFIKTPYNMSACFPVCTYCFVTRTKELPANLNISNDTIIVKRNFVRSFIFNITDYIHFTFMLMKGIQYF